MFAPVATASGALLEIGGLLLLLGVSGRVADRFGLSPIPFYLLIGLALGAAGTGPLTFDPEVVELGAEIGLVLLLFMLGLEYATNEITRNVRTVAPSGALDLVLNLVPGVACGLLLGWELEAALVLGGVTYISSSGIVVKLVDDLGRGEHPETPAVVALLVFEDLVMAGYLPLLAVILAGAGLLSGVLSLAAAAIGVSIALAVGLRAPHLLTRALSPRTEEVFLLTIFGTVLVVAGAAEAAHLSAGVGAFLAGIALADPVVERARNVLTPLRDLFAAAFFVFFALEIDFGGADALIVPLVALFAVTSLTKVAVGWWAARELDSGPHAGIRAGTALIARGEFSVVVAGVGVTAGIEPELGPLAGGYVLATALAGTLLVRLTGSRPAPRASESRLPTPAS